MKKLLMICCVLVTVFVANAQIETPVVIQVTMNKTVSLQFPADVVSADRGSNEVLLQRAKGNRTILLLKAASDQFPETSLTVVTADGNLHSFLVAYADEPSLLQYIVDKGEPLNLTMELVAQLPSSLKRLTVQKSRMSLSLAGIYVKDDCLLLSLNVANTAQIDYSPGSLMFSIVDSKQAKRTARQEIVLAQKDRYGVKPVVAGGENQQWVIALPKFTIPDKKYLSIQLMEAGGGRHLQLRVPGRVILKARALRF